MTVPEGVLIADRSAASGRAAMHPAPALSSHRRRSARLPTPRPGSASGFRGNPARDFSAKASVPLYVNRTRLGFRYETPTLGLCPSRDCFCNRAIHELPARRRSLSVDGTNSGRRPCPPFAGTLKSRASEGALNKDPLLAPKKRAPFSPYQGKRITPKLYKLQGPAFQPVGAQRLRAKRFV